MTVNTAVRQTDPFIGDDVTTTLPFAFKVFTDADLLVVRTDEYGVDETLTLNSDYTVTRNANQNTNPGGEVELADPLASDFSVVITTDIAATQGASIPNNSAFFATIVENALDKLTILYQQLSARTAKALRFPVSDGITLSQSTLPGVAERAGSYLAFDAGGLPVMASGTGADSALRTDLGSSAGSASVGLLPAGGSAVATTMQAKARQVITTHDVMTAAQIAAAEAGTYADLTAVLQDALDTAAGRKLVIMKGAYGVTFDGWGTFGMALNVPSDIVIEFEPGATIQAMAHDDAQYQIFRVWDKEDVTFIRPTINGRKDLNTTGSSDDFGMGIDVRGSARVRIIDSHITNCWGDGIYIGEGTVTDYCNDCSIVRPTITDCRRQGISVVSVDGLDIDGGRIENIGDQLPGAGIDIEPNNNDNVLRNIKIDGLKTVNCTAGIAIYLAAWDGAVAKTINVTISNHEDDGSTTAFTAGGCDPGANVINGAILNLDPLYVNTDERACYVYEWAAAGPVVDIIRPVVVDPNRSAGVSTKYNSPFVCLRDSGSGLTYPIGNMRVFEPSVILNSGTIPALFLFQDAQNDTSLPADNLERCHFIDPILLSGLGTGNMLKGVLRGKGFISDRYQQWKRTAAGSETLTDFSIGHVQTAGAATFTLSADYWPAGGPDLIFSTTTTDSNIIDPPASGGFIGETVDYRLQSVTAHSYLRLRPVGSNFFQIIERVGLWSAIV